MSDEQYTGVAIVIFILGLLAAAWFSNEQCAQKFQDYEHQWGPIQGCLVKYDGKWIPADNFYEAR